MTKPKLVIVGDSPVAEVAYELFTHDSPYEVVAFSVEEKFLKRDSLFDKPIVPFESLSEKYSPDEHHAFVAVAYTQLNRLRKRLAGECKAKGYSLASYVSSKAFVWQNAQIGEHCFILENNVIQPFVKIGENVILWSGNHIGHHTVVESHCFIASHIVISGHCVIGEHTFMGVNATVANNVTIGPDCLIGAGAIILKNAPGGKIYGTKPTLPKEGISSLAYFGVEESTS